MTPTSGPSSLYDGVEMPTSGLFNWNSVSSGRGISFWTSSSNQLTGFAQNGFAVNQNDYSVCDGAPAPGNPQVCEPPHSWSVWYEYCFNCAGTYYGNAIIPLAGWNPTDHIYFSIATYSSKGEYSFLFTDSTTGQSVAQWVCNTAVSGRFTGTVGALSEDSLTGGYGNVYLSSAALWAQVQSTGLRNSGNANAYNSGDSPSSNNINVISPNVFNLGFTAGTHYTNGALLWSGSYSIGNEDYPADHCPATSTSLSANSITQGGSVYDTATLSGVTTDAGGTVTYYYSTSNTCPASSPTTVNSVTVTNGVVPNSNSQIFNAAGTYYWYAVYSGDAKNNGATSPCEPLTVSASQYYLTMAKNGVGTVSPSSGYYNAGSQVIITATQTCRVGLSKGWSFNGWTGSGSGSYSGFNNPATITMNGPITETATFVYGLCPQIVQPPGAAFGLSILGVASWVGLLGTIWSNWL